MTSMVSRMYIPGFGSKGVSDAKSTRSTPKKASPHAVAASAPKSAVSAWNMRKKIDRPALERPQHLRQIDARGPRSELVPPVADAALEVRHHPAHVMRDDFEAGMFVEQSREDDARHGGAGFVRPAERPPDLELRCAFG